MTTPIALPGSEWAGSRHRPESAPSIFRIAALRSQSIISVGIKLNRRTKLLQIADTAGCSCPHPRLVQRRQQHRRQNRDDRNHDEELYKRKCRFGHCPAMGDRGRVRRSPHGCGRPARGERAVMTRCYAREKIMSYNINYVMFFWCVHHFPVLHCFFDIIIYQQVIIFFCII